MTFEEISKLLTDEFGEQIQVNPNPTQPFISVAPEALGALANFLRNDPRLFFDFLACLTGLDNGAQADTMEVVYNLDSIVREHSLMVKTTLPRNDPKIQSVSSLWRTADWHEREAYDLLGVIFTDHPDLRRILLPEDWVGHPLRKDYEHQEKYHGIYVAYGDREDPALNNPDRA